MNSHMEVFAPPPTRPLLQLPSRFWYSWGTEGQTQLPMGFTFCLIFVIHRWQGGSLSVSFMMLEEAVW